MAAAPYDIALTDVGWSRQDTCHARYPVALCAHLNGEYFLILDSGQQLKLSRSYKEKVRLLH